MGTVTIHKDNTGVYTVSIQLGSEKPFVKIPEKTGAVVGIDLNTDNFYSDSNGNVIPNPRYYKRSLVRLKKQQRILSRRILRAKKENRSIRESKNVQKQRIKVAMISKRVYNQRNSFLDKASKTLIENQDLVVAEELRTKNMLKNHALAQAISDVGWRLMLQKLAYKSELYGKTFVTINPNNTSRICSSCGQKNHEFDDLTQNEWLATREWTCPTCHQYHDRDVNAAKNILSKGLEELAK